MKPILRLQTLLLFCLVGLSAFAASVVVEPITRSDSTIPPSRTGNGASTAPVLSANGRFVAFTSDASNLVTNYPGRGPQFPYVNVFLRDLTTGRTALVSEAAEGARSGDGHSAACSISADGRYVTFESEAANLVAQDDNGTTDIFVRDTVLKVTRLISARRGGGGSGNEASTDPVITPDSRFVAFVSAAADLTPNDTNGIPDVFVRDLQVEVTMLVSTGARSDETASSASRSPAISDNGRAIAFFSTALGLVPEVTDASGHVYVRDLSTGAISWLSRQPSTNFPPRSVSFNPVISADGRFVAFRSAATDLTDDPPGFGMQVFLHDLGTGQTTLLTRTASGRAGHGFSGTPLITPDGRAVIFASAAEDLVTGDFNNAGDVFIARISPLPAEAGFRISAEVVEGNVLRLSWPVQSGRNFQIQHRQDLATNAWMSLPASITVQGTTASATLPLPQSAKGFYRVLAMP